MTLSRPGFIRNVKPKRKAAFRQNQSIEATQDLVPRDVTREILRLLPEILMGLDGNVKMRAVPSAFVVSGLTTCQPKCQFLSAPSKPQLVKLVPSRLVSLIIAISFLPRDVTRQNLIVLFLCKYRPCVPIHHLVGIGRLGRCC